MLRNYVINTATVNREYVTYVTLPARVVACVFVDGCSSYTSSRRGLMLYFVVISLLLRLDTFLLFL